MKPGKRFRTELIMKKTSFTSVLDPGYRDDLEGLLFFNQYQDRFRSDALVIVQRYGMPHVKTIDGRLRIVFDSMPEPQTLYVLEQSTGRERLIGVMVYLREGDSLLLVLAAIHEAYLSIPLAWKMIDVLRDIARRVKGIATVILYPGSQRERRLAPSRRMDRQDA